MSEEHCLAQNTHTHTSETESKQTKFRDESENVASAAVCRNRSVFVEDSDTLHSKRRSRRRGGGGEETANSILFRLLIIHKFAPVCQQTNRSLVEREAAFLDRYCAAHYRVVPYCVVSNEDRMSDL